MTRKPKVIAISDTHNLHQSIVIPKCDILIHAGDGTTRGQLAEIQPFLNWLQSQKAKHKIYVPGNHDRISQNEQSLVRLMCKERGIVFLYDEAITVMGLNIWGSPITPTFRSWAFMRDRGEEIRDHWFLIPRGLDILITHGPPYGILDMVPNKGPAGCQDLLARVMEVKPKIHIFGHIHQNNGVKEILGVQFYNVAVCDNSNKLIGKETRIKI